MFSNFTYYCNRIVNKSAIWRNYIAKKSDGYWQCTKDKHRGCRGFVIGNGPSLRASDLEILQNEVCIASNKIYLIFDRTSWRPTYYTIVDPLVWRNIATRLPSSLERVHIPNYLTSMMTKRQLHIWRSLSVKKLYGDVNHNMFSDDLRIGAYGGSTVTYENLQLAVHLGLNPIYIIGCDHNYEMKLPNRDRNGLVEIEASSYFTENYIQPGEKSMPPLYENMEEAYMRACLYGKRHGVQIYNATRGGRLNVFPRINFDSIDFS